MGGRYQIANNATTTLAVGIGTGDTTFSVAAGTGARFPSSGYFHVTIVDAGNVPEVVKVTARSVDTFTTVARGQDGTAARSFSAGASVRLNLTAGVINELAAKPDDNSFTGNNSFAGTTDLNGGGTLAGSFGGVATFTGQQTFTHASSTFAGTAAIATHLSGSWAYMPSGTKATFNQTAAPTGWTKDVTHNDKALRVVSGAVGSGGTVDFSVANTSTAFSGTVGSTTLSTAQMPSHAHSLSVGFYGYGAFVTGWEATVTNQNTNTATSGDYVYALANGGGGSHNHSFSGSVSMSVKYVDVIIATKD